MATGDQDDLFSRIKRLLNAPQWFGEGETDTPILDAMLQAPAWGLSFVYSLFAYAKLQTRIATATDGFLDLIAADYFGPRLRRRQNQSDTSFRSQILGTVLKPKATRSAMANALTVLTGAEPIICEPRRATDVGAYGTGLYYGSQGRYGSSLMPYQALVVAFRPLQAGVPFRSGYGDPQGAYGRAAQFAYAGLEQITGSVTDQDIIDAVNDVRPAASTIWMRITTQVTNAPTPFVLDESELDSTDVLG